MDFVSREALITAVNAWILDKSKSLDEILLDQGALAADERDILEPLIRKHLQRHGGDPGRCLASLGTQGPAGGLEGHLRHRRARKPCTSRWFQRHGCEDRTV